MQRYQELAIEQVCMSTGHPYQWEQIRYDAEAYRQYTVDALHYVDRMLPNGTALDVGCGYGTMAAYLADIGWTGVLAVDIDPLPYIPFLDKYGVQFIQRDIEREEIGGSFDLVVATELLEHFGNDPIGAMKKIAGVTRTGGTLIFSTPNKGHAWWKAGGSLQKRHKITSYKDIKKAKVGSVGNIDNHYYHYTQQEVTALLCKVGFDVRTNELQQKHIYVVAVKR